jgi:hypothetical protein
MNERGVFINCPFSSDYQEFLEAILFVVKRSGFEPRCALENDDGSEVRFDKICRIVGECRYGIHDISKTDPDTVSGLPRFNMPLELGLFLGAKKFGGKIHVRKKTLILDREAHRYQSFISDISGQDIHAHQGQTSKVIEHTAAWLRREANDRRVPGGRAIAGEFQRFQKDLIAIAGTKRLERSELTFSDVSQIATEWILAEDGEGRGPPA